MEFTETERAALRKATSAIRRATRMLEFKVMTMGYEPGQLNVWAPNSSQLPSYWPLDMGLSERTDHHI